MSERRFFLQTTSGDKFEIAEIDFNNIENRIATGRTNGWYMQRGDTKGDRHEWKVNFRDVAGVWSDKPEKVKPRPEDSIDVQKRKPQPVGKVEKEVPKGCTCNWQDKETFDYVKQNVGGKFHYRKQCTVGCEKKSNLVKPREVELAMEERGLTLDDVPLVE